MQTNREFNNYPKLFGGVLSRFNLSGSKVCSFADSFRDNNFDYKKIRIKGHLVHSPRNEQIYDKLSAVLNQGRIKTWAIFDKSDEFVNDSKDAGVWKKRNIKDIDLIVVHTTDSMSWTSEDVFMYDISKKNHITPGKGLPGITYHMFVDAAGNTEKTSKLSNVTWHAAGYNSRSIGVAIPYRATGASKPPSSYIMRGLVRTLSLLILRLKLNPYKAIRGHRELSGTGFIMRNGHKRLKKTCPGLLVDLNYLRTNVAVEVQKILQRITTNNSLYVIGSSAGEEKLYAGAIDGKFGKKTKKALKNFHSEAIDVLLSSTKVKEYLGEEWDPINHPYKYGVK